MGWVLIGLGVVLLLIGIAAVIGITHYTRLSRCRGDIVTRWEALKTELDRRHAVLPPLARAVAAKAQQQRPALEDLLTVQDHAARLRGLDQLPQRAASEERLAAGLRRLQVTADSVPGLARDPAYATLSGQLNQTTRRIAEAAAAYNLAVDSYRQQASRGWSRHVARLAHWPAPNRFEGTPRRGSDNDPAGRPTVAASPALSAAARPAAGPSPQPATRPAAARPTPARAAPPVDATALRGLAPTASVPAHPRSPGVGPAALGRPEPEVTRDTRPTFIPSYDPAWPRLSPANGVPSPPRPAVTLSGPAQPNPARPADPPTAAPVRPTPTRPTGDPAPDAPAAPSSAPLGVLDFWRSRAQRPLPPRTP